MSSMLLSNRQKTSKLVLDVLVDESIDQAVNTTNIQSNFQTTNIKSICCWSTESINHRLQCILLVSKQAINQLVVNHHWPNQLSTLYRLIIQYWTNQLRTTVVICPFIPLCNHQSISNTNNDNVNHVANIAVPQTMNEYHERHQAYSTAESSPTASHLPITCHWSPSPCHCSRWRFKFWSQHCPSHSRK